MKLNNFHIDLLARRTYLDKFGIEVGYGPNSYSQALDELISEGYVVQIDSNFFHPDTRRFISVYQLTEKGVELCKKHNIIATNP